VNSDEEPTAGSGANQWIRSNIAAIGSAAVLAVYAAGYAKTKSAADLYADESNVRRPQAIEPTSVIAQVETPRAPEPSAPSVKKEASANPVAPKATAKALAKAAAAKASVAPVVSTPAPALPAQSPPVQSPPVAAPPTAVTAPASPVPQPPTDSAKPPEKIVLKDGVYSGWGTSRHGDIQAYVEVKAGKIVTSFISECLTQYSCSWIEKLPGQVVTRQSADVDYVSGATQSSNAFYYAVVNALKQAK
jgi:uncharacterized protein with FMN-binding domain